MNFLVIQHLDIEPAALIAEMLEEAGHHLATIHLDQGQSLPSVITGFDGIIIMGGPQSANDNTNYILAELKWLGSAIEEGIPMLGICLGAQLMAKATGAEVFTSPVRELGWFPVCRTENTATDTLFCDMPEVLYVFQWHGETFSLTDAMTLIATHPEVPDQAFRLGKGQYGLQFHIEVNQPIIDTWIRHSESERDDLGVEGIRQLHCDSRLYLESARHFCRQLVHAWVMDIDMGK